MMAEYDGTGRKCSRATGEVSHHQQAHFQTNRSADLVHIQHTVKSGDFCSNKHRLLSSTMSSRDNVKRDGVEFERVDKEEGIRQGAKIEIFIAASAQFLRVCDSFSFHEGIFLCVQTRLGLFRLFFWSLALSSQGTATNITFHSFLDII